jgi:putative GTP pyrophosphokinase
MELSKTQIDQLGDRLRIGSPSETDLISLDEFRRSFGPAYETVVRTIREELHREPTGRPAKSTSSLLDKLNRESIRLTQVQDIAGCRIVVPDVLEQDHLVEVLQSVFPGSAVKDRREKSSYGYRAVHVIVEISGNLVEIQVRTEMQHAWADLSEKWSDVIDPSIKYGGGPPAVRNRLHSMSDYIANIEQLEYNYSRMRQIDDMELQQHLDGIDLQVLDLKRELSQECRDLITWLEQNKDS